MFVSGRRGAVITTLLQDTPHTYARRGAPAAPLSLDAALDGFCWVGRYLASAMTGNEETATGRGAVISRATEVRLVALVAGVFRPLVAWFDFQRRPTTKTP